MKIQVYVCVRDVYEYLSEAVEHEAYMLYSCELFWHSSFSFIYDMTVGRIQLQLSSFVS